MPETPEPDWRDQVPNLIPPALRMAIRLIGDPQIAEEAVQEALVKLARYGAGFRGQAQLSTYFTRIVINVCHDLMARNQQRCGSHRAQETVVGPQTQQPEFIHEQIEQVTRIRQAVDRLPVRQRTVLVLSVWEQRTPEEIGQMLKISVQNVYSTLSAARKQLRQMLSEESVE